MDNLDFMPEYMLKKTTYIMPLSHFSGHNLWVLKPIGLNRGNGIHIFRDLKDLKKLIDNYVSKKKKEVNFIIQKYIEKPLLIHNRKFDIRIWVLITQKMECYMFKEGYIRTSSSIFRIDLTDIDNKFVHLTNNAIQKDGKDYSKFEDGNQISFFQFHKYMKNTIADFDFNGIILTQIKDIIRKTYYATINKLNPHNNLNSFEIFGYDFMIDDDLNTWLIEVNTNPCIEESSTLLKALIPRMLDDAFRLTLDEIFPNLGKNRKVYPVIGYDNEENMW